MTMTTERHPLDFAARQAAKATAREADAQAREQQTKTPAEILAANFWFAGVKPEQVTVDYSRCRELY
jgi:hypothetical protein